MRTIVVAGFLLACAGSASAQALKLEFNAGRVSLDATAVPVRTILSEWARLGGTKVVGAERIAGSPLTIHLENVSEAEALEVVLRNVAGYMAAPRQAASIGASAYDRILVMPTSTAPQATAAGNRPSTPANANAPAQRPGRGPFGGAPNQAAPAQDPDVNAAPAPDEADTGVNEPPFQFPQQNPNPFQGAGQPGAYVQPGVRRNPVRSVSRARSARQCSRDRSPRSSRSARARTRAWSSTRRRNSQHPRSSSPAWRRTRAAILAGSAS